MLRMQNWFNIQKWIDTLHSTDKMKDKEHVIILIDAEKESDKIQYAFMIKTFNQEHAW